MNKITDHAIAVVVLSTATLIVCLMVLLTGGLQPAPVDEWKRE
jgi:hypothetical protein